MFEKVKCFLYLFRCFILVLPWMAAHILSRDIQDLIAHNVQGIRRFGRADKQTAGLQPCQNVAEFWRGNEAARPNDLAARNPEGPLGPEAHTVLLCAVPPYFIFFIPAIFPILPRIILCIRVYHLSPSLYNNVNIPHGKIYAVIVPILIPTSYIPIH
jgi:hypothetical protein